MTRVVAQHASRQLLGEGVVAVVERGGGGGQPFLDCARRWRPPALLTLAKLQVDPGAVAQSTFRGKAHQDGRSEEHTSELQSQSNLVCRLLLEKKKAAIA